MRHPPAGTTQVAGSFVAVSFVWSHSRPSISSHPFRPRFQPQLLRYFAMTTACIPSTLVAPNVRSPERPTLLNLLIVDDDRFVREACREAAVALGYSGKTTESIEQAMLMAESQSIDVVLLGAKLTDTPQLEILQRFKERHPNDTLASKSS